jgi:hypothetical protein
MEKMREGTAAAGAACYAVENTLMVCCLGFLHVVILFGLASAVADVLSAGSRSSAHHL